MKSPSSLSYILHPDDECDDYMNFPNSPNELNHTELTPKRLNESGYKRRKRPVCSIEGCEKTSKSTGKCNGHGGGKICAVISCTKFVISHGLCFAHGVSAQLYWQ